jgi:CBS domain-containing protein
MRIHEVMTPGVICARPGHSLSQAADRMRELDVGSLPVCGEDDKLAGMITDRDITVRATADGCDPNITTVHDVMTNEIVTCCEDDDVQKVAKLMEQKQIRRLAVLNQDKRLVGIVSLGDLAVRNQDDRLSGEVLEQVSEPAMPAR